MRNLWVSLLIGLIGFTVWVAASAVEAQQFPRRVNYGYSSSVAPRTYLYGQGAPGLYPSRFGSGFGGYNTRNNIITPVYGPGFYGHGWNGGFQYGLPGNNAQIIIIGR
jgi:hypothetical protein